SEQKGQTLAPEQQATGQHGQERGTGRKPARRPPYRTQPDTDGDHDQGDENEPVAEQHLAPEQRDEPLARGAQQPAGFGCPCGVHRSSDWTHPLARGAVGSQLGFPTRTRSSGGWFGAPGKHGRPRERCGAGDGGRPPTLGSWGPSLCTNCSAEGGEVARAIGRSTPDIPVNGSTQTRVRTCTSPMSQRSGHDFSENSSARI